MSSSSFVGVGGLHHHSPSGAIYHDDGEFEGRNVLNWGQIYPGDVLRFEP
jgi:hypothetical protein